MNPSRDWTLRGARSADGGSSVFIRDGRIALDPCSHAREVDLEGCVVLPGRINAHDHLEFALFPRLGSGPWSNASAWAEAVHQPDHPPVKNHLRVAKSDRLRWGGLRNLLSGVTTVCHHNPYDPQVFGAGFPVRVLERFGWAHSLAFASDPAASRRATPPGAPFILHLGEGTDKEAAQEIFTLDEAGLLDGQTVVVHGVGLGVAGLDLLRRRDASLIWCPSSNLFTLGETIDPAALPPGLPVALGTDSPLTAAGDLFDELAAARRRSPHLTAAQLAAMTGPDAAKVLRMEDGQGGLAIGDPADLIVLRDKGGAVEESLFDDPALEGVMIGGRWRLSGIELALPLRGALEYAGRRFLVDMEIESLYEGAVAVLGDAIRLAGKPVKPW